MSGPESSNIVNIGDMIGEALQEHFGELPEKVVERIARAPYDAYVAVAYDWMGGTAVFRAQIELVEKLLAPIRLTKGGTVLPGRVVDAMVHKALGSHGQYVGHPRQRRQRIREKFYFTDNTIEFLSFIRLEEYRPRCILLQKVDDSTRDRLLAKDPAAWESFYVAAENALAQRRRRVDRKEQQRKSA